MSRKLTLFDLDKYLVRNEAFLQEFEETFKDFLPDLYQAFDNAFIKMCSARSKMKTNEMNSRWPSNSINGFLYSILVENPKFAPYLKKKNNTFYFEKDHYKISFKKVDRKYRPSYNPTINSQLLENNRTASDNDLKTVIYIGYQVDSTWSTLLNVSAISRSDKKLNWVSDLSQFQVSAQILPFETATRKQDQDNNSVVEPKVRLKSNAKRKIKNA